MQIPRRMGDNFKHRDEPIVLCGVRGIDVTSKLTGVRKNQEYWCFWGV
mgnify:CR=1 FL=1